MMKLLSVFLTIFMAELGDKTQLATLLFASEKQYPAWQVFLASASALVLSSALAVLVGGLMSRYLTAVPLKLIAGIGFIIIGFWTLLDHFRSA